jgi:hypothetical protein
MKNQIFVPASAKSLNELESALEMQKPLREKGYVPGFELVFPGGLPDLYGLEAAVQKENLNKIKGRYGSAQIVLHMSNLPIENLNFFNPEKAAYHIMQGISFAERLPIEGIRTVNFHLNTLVPEEDFLARTKKSWEREFDKKILPELKRLSDYAKAAYVELTVETVPVPEFGDISDKDPRTYMGVKLNELRNPYYLTKAIVARLKGIDIGICVDLSHSMTLYEAPFSKLDSLLFEEDKKEFLDGSLLEEVRSLNYLDGDPCHLCDGDGLYSKKPKSLHREGLPLGRGEITEMKQIIGVLNKNEIPFVLEMTEKDYVNRPNTKASVDYILHNI